MTQQWRIQISGKPRKDPDIALLVQAVLLLAGDMQVKRDAAEREQSPDNRPPEHREEGV